MQPVRPLGMRYLLDSNVLSEMQKIMPSEALATRLAQETHLCATASVVAMELYWGAHLLSKGARRDGLLAVFEKWFHSANAMPVLTFDLAAAQWAAFENARLQKIGLPRPWRDSQIAAIAATNNLILVTRNVADFAPFEGLKIQNWFEAAV